MHDTLTAVNNSTVSGLGRLAGFFGFNDVMGRLYGTLLLNPEPLSLDEAFLDMTGAEPLRMGAPTPGALHVRASQDQGRAHRAR